MSLSKFYSREIAKNILSVTMIVTATFCLTYTVSESSGLENFTEVTDQLCAFSSVQGATRPNNCFQVVTDDNTTATNAPTSGYADIIKLPVTSTINMQEYNSSRIVKSKILLPSSENVKYDNVGEPSFASNGTLIMYTGNHYATHSFNGKDWGYIDPTFDFMGREETSDSEYTGTMGRIFPIFKADQHVEYDPIRKMFIWIRQGDNIQYGHGLANIDRLAISRDTINWIVYDFVSSDVLKNADPPILRARFDYPDTILTDKFLFVTTSIINYDIGKLQGLILRIPLDELADSLERDITESPPFRYDIILDRDVEAISPVEGSSQPAYFGSHVPGNSYLMKIYAWKDDSLLPETTIVPITPWNSVNNHGSCGSDLVRPEYWWCKSNTSSRIRSAWMSGDSINFLWNALTSYDNGTIWMGYIDSATFHMNEDINYERKYHLAEENRSWFFGAASPNKNGDIGVGAYYLNNSKSDPNHIYFHFAFGVFDDTNRKWKMMPVISSSMPIPVKNESGVDDYNFGDFFTVRKHAGSGNEYLWDLGAYAIEGKSYSDIQPYFIMVRQDFTNIPAYQNRNEISE